MVVRHEVGWRCPLPGDAFGVVEPEAHDEERFGSALIAADLLLGALIAADLLLGFVADEALEQLVVIWQHGHLDLVVVRFKDLRREEPICYEAPHASCGELDLAWTVQIIQVGSQRIDDQRFLEDCFERKRLDSREAQVSGDTLRSASRCNNSSVSLKAFMMLFLATILSGL
ncbi:hypothetical protein HYQ46_008433 [Verticillium longisporum]|nr:hypothetical protein HYQ46_008433 [Verticillium longisporum]